MRSRSRLRVILDAEDRTVLVTQTLDSLVIQVDPVDDYIRGKGSPIHRKPVVLGGDFHPAGLKILDRLVATTMTKLELEGLATQGLTQDLMA